MAKQPTPQGISALVWHDPAWEPAQLPIDAAGNTQPGYVCVHELENGNGQCGGNVFHLDQAVGQHCCHVDEEVVALPTFEEMRRNAHRLLGDAQDELRSGWEPGTGPTPKQAELLHEARAGIARAKAALDEAAR